MNPEFNKLEYTSPANDFHLCGKVREISHLLLIVALFIEGKTEDPSTYLRPNSSSFIQSQI